MAIDPLLADLGRILRQHEFRKKGNRWFRNGGEVIDLLEVQGSQHGGGYFLNLGVLLRELAPLDLEPKSYDCHFMRRLDEGGREAPAIAAEALAWFDSLASRRKMEALFASGESGALITRVAFDKLPPLPPIPPPPVPVRVKHVKFGAGVITGTFGASVDVAFDDGLVRRIRRDFLEDV